VLGLAVVLALGAPVAHARAPERPQGFAVERLYPSGPGGGWFVMDDLDIHGGLGGALALTLGYANNPLRVSDGLHRVAVVSDQFSADIAAAITYRRWRFYLNLDAPLWIGGTCGIVGNYSFTAPAVDLGSNPDTLSDARVGADMRIFGRPGSRFRLGVSAQLLIPFGERSDYDTDDMFRGMLRVLFAGDAPYFTYAGHVGVHIRSLDDSPTPGSPHGSELLFGVAAGAKLPIGHSQKWVAVVGPEIYGATAFRAFLDENGTALEGLLTGRIEGARDDKLQVRVKLGVGAGLNHHFGAAEWRVVVGVEMFNHRQPAATPP
jgi:hypothetical protein